MIFGWTPISYGNHDVGRNMQYEDERASYSTRDSYLRHVLPDFKRQQKLDVAAEPPSPMAIASVGRSGISPGSSERLREVHERGADLFFSGARFENYASCLSSDDLENVRLQLQSGKCVSICNHRFTNEDVHALVQFLASYCPELTSLDLSGCCRITQMPPLDIFTSLTKLRLRGCYALLELPRLSQLRSLVELDLRGCYRLRILPSLRGLTQLKVLTLRGCLKLETLPSFDELVALEHINLRGCERLTKLRWTPFFRQGYMRNLAHENLHGGKHGQAYWTKTPQQQFQSSSGNGSGKRKQDNCRSGGFLRGAPITSSGLENPASRWRGRALF